MAQNPENNSPSSSEALVDFITAGESLANGRVWVGDGFRLRIKSTFSQYSVVLWKVEVAISPKIFGN
jgi:hypothetical protein